jgi:hypothetical protein
MSHKARIVSLIKEAEIYRAQGLMKIEGRKYLETLQQVEGHARFSKDAKLIFGLKGKISGIESDIEEILRAPDKPELPEQVQVLIRNLFAFSENENAAAIEGAFALAKFGQHEGAIREFRRLIREGILPMVAAKNLLRCHLTLSSADVAVDEFKQWVSTGTFSKIDLILLQGFLEQILEAKGIKLDLPQVEETPPGQEVSDKKAEEGLELSSISVQLEVGPEKGQRVEFEVSYQSGSKLSVVVPADQKELADAFQPGLRLAEVRCYSSLAVFNTTATVTGKSEIPSGPKRGSYYRYFH